MENEELLPKPFTQPNAGQTDLPLPEKEIPAHIASQDLQSKGEALESQTHQSIFRNKVFILSIILSFLVAFLIGGFILGRNSVLKELNPSAPSIPPKDPVIYETTPVPNPTADWKTFTNTERGYSFKYDPKLKVESAPNTQIHLEEVIVYIAPVELVKGAGNGETLSKGSHALFTIYEQKDISDAKLIDQYGSEVEIGEKTIGGKVFKSIRFPDETLANIYYYEIGPAEVLEISAWVGFNNTNEEKAEYLKTFDQILSTFKFN